MNSVPIRVRLPSEYYAGLVKEQNERHVTLTTVIWERLGILPPVENSVRTVRTNQPQGKAVPSVPTVPSSKKTEAVQEGHVHKWGNRSTITGLKRCECGALKS